MTVNVTLLKQLRTEITDEMFNLNICEWFTGVDSEHPCGTAQCIAGRVCMLLGYRPTRHGSTVYKDDPDDTYFIPKLATEALGLSPEEADDLFHEPFDKEQAIRHLTKLIDKYDTKETTQCSTTEPTPIVPTTTPTL
jgi:hypothetical protein